MTIKKLIEEAYQRQLNYGLQGQAKDIKRFTSYLIEECVEVNREVSWGADRYKPFKASKPVDEQALAEELSDIVIHTFNLLAVSGISPETLAETIEYKLQYNKTRHDHLEKKC